MTESDGNKVTIVKQDDGNGTHLLGKHGERRIIKKFRQMIEALGPQVRVAKEKLTQ